MAAARIRVPHLPLHLLLGLALTAMLAGVPAAPVRAATAAANPPFYPVATAAFLAAGTVGASVDNTLVLWGNGSATATVDLPGPARRLVFEAQAQVCDGPPRLLVRVDGVGMFGREIAGAGAYAVAGSWPAGPHTLTFAFTNDRLSDTCDRNLKIRSVGWWGPHSRYGAIPVHVHQHLDMSAVAFSSPGVGVSSTRAATLWTTASFAGALDTQAGEYLYLETRTTACAEQPRFTLRVDGVIVTVEPYPPETYGEQRAFFAVGDWTNRTHTLEIGYLNGQASTGCDPYLAVTQLSFAGYV